jgi:hypothetical protein
VFAELPNVQQTQAKCNKKSKARNHGLAEAGNTKTETCKDSKHGVRSNPEIINQ